MSELDDRFVHRGFWIDRSRGSIMGQTYTVKAEDGILVVAILTILASMATAQLWSLLTFLLHQLKANGDPSDGLFWSHQVLLRTMPTPTAFIADSLKLSWRWRSKIPHALLRSSLLLLFAIFFAIAAIAGGLSTSYALDNSNIEVLVKGPLCGRVNHARAFSKRAVMTLLPALNDAMHTYALNCYGSNTSLAAPCRNTFSRPSINFKTTPAPCPWNAAMCTPGESPAVEMDSGLLDLRIQFGVNVDEEDTVKFRKRTTCSVLPSEGRIITRNESYWRSRGYTDDMDTLNYGTYRDVPARLRPEATFWQAKPLTKSQRSFGSDAIMHYTFPDTAYLGINTISEMTRNDADVAVMAVWLNSVMFDQPVNDPLFAAHRHYDYILDNDTNYTMYLPDSPAGVVGCALQYQICLPQAGKQDNCTQLHGSSLEVTSSGYPNAKPIQISILQLLQSISRIISITNGPLTGDVRASKTISRGYSPGLPDDQWVKEVIGWESLAWTGFQMLLSASVIGPKVFDEYADDYTDVPTNEGDKALCRSLRMRKSGGFANVNVFALALITTMTAVITILNLFVLRFLIFLSRFRSALAPRIDRWVQDGVFQLQRRAFEAYGEGNWVDLYKEIPLTERREKLAEVPINSMQMMFMKAGTTAAKDLGTGALDEHAFDGNAMSVADDGTIQPPDRNDSGLTLKDEYGDLGSMSKMDK